MKKYLDVDQEAGKKFYLEYIGKGKISMLNLLRYKEKADYSKHENLKPEAEISGEAAYQIYIDKTLPELQKAGSKIIYYGKSKHFLIGPESETWDAVLLVQHESVEKFLAFAENENYLKTYGHRFAALDDSRLLPMSEVI